MKEGKEDIPPNSRLFVLHSKNTNKEELQEAFEKFGKVEDIWMVRDRDTQELKGVTYVKFSKMSEACLAVEEMNGVALPSNVRPLKVIIANSREEGSRKDDDIERFIRIFIVVARDGSDTEETLRKHFKTFGEVDSVIILKNRETNENKGFAYIKFKKMSHAAKALEGCDQRYKAVLAKPRDKRESNNFSRSSPPDRKYNSSSSSSRHANLCDGYAIDLGYTRVSAFISTDLSEDLAIRLFNLVPGLSFARLTDDVISHRTQKMILGYDTAEAASFAVDRLNGFEYPIGEPIMLKPEREREPGPSVWQHSPTHMSSYGSKFSYNDRKRDYSGQSRSSTMDRAEYSNYKKISSLTNALDEANNIIRAHGLTSDNVAKLCTARLPPIQPILKDVEGKFRLFVVCKPEAPPVSALKDIFCRFGNFVDVYLLPGKNYGYASFACEESAQRAIEVLHGEELYGNRLKVIIADPRGESSNKRQRYD